VPFASVSITPTPSDLPGAAELQKLANGLDGWALLLALIALVIGAAMWALGSHSQNMHHSMIGRRTVLTSILAAVVLGAAPTLINFFFSAGTAVH
jgi:type IV secretory pathway VirB2 component (pilin)